MTARPTPHPESEIAMDPCRDARPLTPSDEAGRFRPGDRVRVLEAVVDANPRTPTYLRGLTGSVVVCHGVVVNPLDHHDPYPPLYSVLFDLDDGRPQPDQVLADLHEEWLEAAD